MGEPLSTVFTATAMAGYLRIFKCAAAGVDQGHAYPPILSPFQNLFTIISV